MPGGLHRERQMAKQCEICGKSPVVGRQVSHAHNVSARRFEPNLQTVRAMINGGVRRIRVCTRCLRRARSSKRRCEAGVSQPARAPKADRTLFIGAAAGNLLFISGQVPLDPATGSWSRVTSPLRRAGCCDNIGALLEAAGLDFAHVVRTTVFLADMNDFAAMNEVYGTTSRAVSRPVDGPGGAAAARRPRRDRRRSPATTIRLTRRERRKRQVSAG